MSTPAADDLACDLLLFYATGSEEKAIKEAVARRPRLTFGKKKHPLVGEFRVIGTVGTFRVVAVRTEMGPLGFGGSAAKGIYFKATSGATAIVQVGMAFGVDPARQTIGDVLVSSSVIPYDRRDVIGQPDGGYVVDYSPARPEPARPSIVHLFREAGTKPGLPFRVHVGAILSGGAAISSARFRDELVGSIPPTDEPIVGGEMEGVGLVAVSNPDDPAWVVVKGISDFADDKRADTLKTHRPIACGNSVEFVLGALESATAL